MRELDQCLTKYLSSESHMSRDEMFAIEAKKLGTRAQVRRFLELREKTDPMVREIASLEMWYGSLGVVYAPSEGAQEIDWIGPRGGIQHERRRV